MADNSIIIELEVKEAGAVNKVEILKNHLSTLDKTGSDYENTLKLIAKAERELSNVQQKRILEQKGLEKAVLKGNNAVGASTSATLELGRVLSDMPYGIRGVANNLQQLASNLFFMSKATDAATGKTVGFGGAVKSLVKGLAGPAGILIAFQGLIALFDWLSTNVDEGEKKMNAFNEALSQSSLKLEKMKALASIMNDNTVSIESQKDAMVELKKMGYDPAKRSLDEFIKSQEKLTVINASTKAVEENLTALFKKRLEFNIKAKKEFTDYYKMLNDGSAGVDIQKAVIAQLKIDKSVLDEEEKELKKQYKSLLKRAFDLTDTDVKNETDGGKKLKITPLPTVGEFDLQAKIILSKTEEYNKKIELLTTKTAEDKLEIQLKYEGIALIRSQKSETDKLTSDYNKYVESLEKKEKAYEKSLSKNKDLDDKQRKSLLKSFKDSNNELKEEAKNKLGIQTSVVTSNYEKLLELFEELSKARRNALVPDEEEQATTLEKIAVYIDAYKTLMGGVTEFLNGEFDRQLTMEQDKTNSLNKQLNDRLLNENLSKDERASIQNEIAKNDEKLRLKQDAINRKKFNQQKAFNIASATIDTYAGAAQVLADKKLPSWAKIPMMISIIGSGLAQVAAISRQKFQSSSAATPINTGSGGSGSGSERAEPTFNIVGASGNSALIDTIQSRFDKPLKAYVVSREITSQQQMDSSIITEAGI